MTPGKVILMRTPCIALSLTLCAGRPAAASSPVLLRPEYSEKPGAAAPRWPLTPSRDLALTLGLSGDDACVDVWMSSDSGRSWSWTGRTPDRFGVVRLSVAEDGFYQFYVVATNAAGPSGDDPAVGSTPHATIEVDATPPTFQLISASWPGADQPLSIRAVLIDEHAMPEVRVFYRDGPDRAWVDGGTAPCADGRLSWRPRGRLGSGRIDLRVVASDWAGNCVFDELSDIRTPQARAAVPAPPGLELAARVEPQRNVPDEPGTSPTSRVAADIVHLRSLAAQFSRQGRHELALARLEDALALRPDDGDLLTAAGEACLQLGRLEAADARFAAALRGAADDAGALRGSARLAAARGRHADARHHLLRLVELAPQDAASWLALGDACFQLGEREAASDAWRRALELGGDQEAAGQARRRLEQFSNR
ncbi:Tetratricopeptide repeat protein [Phycisphaerae bacterium RAS1]|nr:Tetratricopeptide repeat protein [Phycisphaerae bacterium RAS1]